MGWMDRHRLPESSGIADLDAPASAMAHRRIIRNKPWLHRLYSDFYRIFVQAVPDPDGKVLVEVGSGGGFLKEMVQPVITSDILELAGVDCVFGGEKMPFASCSVDAFFLFDALHHMADPAAFLAEARRCLTPGGRVVMIEPANTPWSRLIYRHLHHEPFIPLPVGGFPAKVPCPAPTAPCRGSSLSATESCFRANSRRLRSRGSSFILPFAISSAAV